MNYSRSFVLLLLMLTLTSCTIPIANFVTNRTDEDLWLEYKPDERYGYIFGDENSQRFRISIDSLYTKKELRKAVNGQRLKIGSEKDETIVKIKLPAKETTYMGNLPDWTDINELISNLNIRIIDNRSNSVTDNLSSKFRIEYGITEIVIQ